MNTNGGKQSGGLKNRFQSLVKKVGHRAGLFRDRVLSIPFFNFIHKLVQGIGNNGSTDMVGSIAYFAFISIFPLMLGIIAVLGYFLPSETVQEQLFTFIEKNIPAAGDLIHDNVESVIEMRGTLGLISIVGLFWSGSVMFSAIGRAVNRAWGVKENRALHVRKARDLVWSLSVVVLFFVLIVITTIISSLNLGGIFINTVLNLVGILFLFLIFWVSYKIIPIPPTHWRLVWPGALFSAVAFIIARLVLTYFFSRFANLEMIYGSLGSIVLLLAFIYYLSFIFIVGAEISSEYSRGTTI